MNNLINLQDFEQAAFDVLDKTVFDYYAGGADGEITLRAARSDWDSIYLRPRVLRDVSQRDLSAVILGQQRSLPLILAPLAMAAMSHPEGELAVARAAGAFGVPMSLSTFATYAIEDVAPVAASPLWLQLYVYKDRAITRRLVERAEAAGFSALMLTVDVPVPGNRERDQRNPFRMPPGLKLKNLAEFQRGTVSDVQDDSAIAAYAQSQLDPSLSWDVIDWLRSISKLPVLVKGILRADDALLALEHGASAVIVSDHGGRQLDTVIPAVYALREIAAAVDGRCEVWIDGGVRRGTDIVKALALGANAVLIGRPVLWGLAVNGELGVHQILKILREEFDRAMALCGCRSLHEITPDLIYTK
jgi:4-hydroxymandelate oxidase